MVLLLLLFWVTAESLDKNLLKFWFFSLRTQMEVYIKREFLWVVATLWDQNLCDGIGANIGFPYFWLKQIFVGLFVVFPQMNIRKAIYSFSGQHTEFLNHYWLSLFRKIPANSKDILLWKDQVWSWDFLKKLLHSWSRQ